MEIHPLAWLTVGMAITVTSVLLRLTFFMYIGIIFMVWGLGKLSYKKLSEPKQLKRSGPVPVQRPVLSQQPSQLHYLHCTRCGNRVHPADHFCSRCGARRSRA